MVNLDVNLSIFTVFLKNRNFTSKIKISKVTDYAALIYLLNCITHFGGFFNISKTFDRA